MKYHHLFPIGVAWGMCLFHGALTASPVAAQEVCTIGQDDHGHDEEDRPEVRAAAAQVVSWRIDAASAAVDPRSLQHVQILAINDFHGQLSAGRRVANRPVGSAPVLASYLKAAQVGQENQTIIVHAGDHVGASPAASAYCRTNRRLCS